MKPINLITGVFNNSTVHITLCNARNVNVSLFEKTVALFRRFTITAFDFK